ncbi:T9SS type A sorting domain-containing protein, partial [Kaistella sp.]|uniref:T9SS type A sorting domain-containing protein n=1 Tax=Kaistella sp. TaxID=2782235 RepID=UPI002F9512FB
STRVSFDNLTWTCYAPMSANDTALINQKLTVYPNPVRNGEFFINGIDKKETLKIYSVTGQLLKSFENVGNNEKVNVQSLAKGVYFITTKTQSAKIIVE